MTQPSALSGMTDPEVLAGQALYSRSTLAIYDLVVLGLGCRLIWRCPKGHMLRSYHRNVGARHLEVGVGTAFFLDKGRFITPNPKITLLDLNPAVLAFAAKRIARYQPEVVQADVLRTFPVPAGSFDSVGMNFLLHCVPGDWETKGAALAGAAAAVRPDGRVFGSTILATGVPIRASARRVMRACNRWGIFHNTRDDLNGLDSILKRHFARHTLSVRGCVALFEASEPRQMATVTGELDR
jgi:SAM-dependent methyltransferase